MIVSVYDIETIPAQSIPIGCKPEFDEAEVKVGSLKDLAKLAAKIAEVESKFQNELDKKMATSPALCQVCLFVGYVYDTGTNSIVSSVISQYTDTDGNDYGIVYDAWEFIRRAYNGRRSIVTFNGKDFDFPVLFHRAMMLDILVDQTMYTALTPKWNCDKLHYDLMKMLVGPYPEKGRNLDFFLRLFRLGQKTEGVDGSQVYELWQAEEHDKILEYGKNDVLMTAKLFARIAPWLVYE